MKRVYAGNNLYEVEDTAEGGHKIKEFRADVEKKQWVLLRFYQGTQLLLEIGKPMILRDYDGRLWVNILRTGYPVRKIEEVPPPARPPGRSGAT